ncbi:hypothetical protein A5717_10480 [Mycolicibacterium porcinum]|uniref:LysR family transcriptional regulator n=1 Tax=Mycolicibacterium porcinum TaxID=39693 RepID=UPI00080BCCF7|nr:LysR family transcriptional regulator [Mycolicibacterium porcinum]OCB14554.1 hypothetical protein A5717_10480 [Mycolicibacterium porcinum]
MTITLGQLEAFVHAVQLKSFTAAADALKMSQPAISDLIRRLESEVGTTLFQRGGRALVVTEAGYELFPYAERSVSSAREGAAAIRALLSLDGGTATFGLLRNADYYLRTDLVRRFRELYPNVRVRLVGQNSVESAAAVATGAVEAALVTLPIDDLGLDVMPIARDEVVYVTADAARAAVPATVEDLCSRPIVLYDAHYAHNDPARRQLNDRAQLIGRRVAPVIEVEYLPTALSLVAEGFGDTIACRAAIDSEIAPRSLHVVSFSEPLYDTLALIKRDGKVLSPATKELARLAYDALHRHQASAKGTAELLESASGTGFAHWASAGSSHKQT